jgi:hypothetical protein
VVKGFQQGQAPVPPLWIVVGRPLGSPSPEAGDAPSLPSDALALFSPAHENRSSSATVEASLVAGSTSLKPIQDACSTGRYTHVHILAHGIPFSDGYDTHFGIYLHGDGPTDLPDVVSGERLATALPATQTPPASGLARAPGRPALGGPG